MRAMVLQHPRTALRDSNIPAPEPGAGQVLVRVAACGVCRTDLHVIDGDLTEPKLPIIPGHEIVGRIEAVGSGVTNFQRGERVGIPWLGHTCGRCPYSPGRTENLCDAPKFTGYQIDGGYAELAVAEAAYCFRLPDTYDDLSAAPLLCAGLIGYRALRMAGDAKRLGIYGFGAAAHIVAQVALFQGRSVYAFTGRATRRLRVSRANSAACGPAPRTSGRRRPRCRHHLCTSRQPRPAALACVRKGGIVVLGGIHMSDVPSMPYSLLWGERVVRSVANLTRQDAKDFLDLAARTAIKPMS